MTTTTIRLPAELKARVARAAKRAGTTSHGFILDAVVQQADAQERREDFHDTADLRYADIVSSGESVPWSRMRAYLEKRMSGKPATRPNAKNLVR